MSSTRARKSSHSNWRKTNSFNAALRPSSGCVTYALRSLISLAPASGPIESLDIVLDVGGVATVCSEATRRGIWASFPGEPRCPRGEVTKFSLLKSEGDEIVERSAGGEGLDSGRVS